MPHIHSKFMCGEMKPIPRMMKMREEKQRAMYVRGTVFVGNFVLVKVGVRWVRVCVCVCEETPRKNNVECGIAELVYATHIII